MSLLQWLKLLKLNEKDAVAGVSALSNDEPGRDSTSIRIYVKMLKACKDAGVRTYLTANR